MFIKFDKDCELEIVESIDPDKEVIDSVCEKFNIGEIFEVDLIGEYIPDNESWQTGQDGPPTYDFQFGDGSCVFGVSSELFTILSSHDNMMLQLEKFFKEEVSIHVARSAFENYKKEQEKGLKV